ncbi:DGQHR domain-containing protein [Rhizobium leguminosarum]|uniref:DGQHR domain-containing protein n=1 Tax=Rhizobium leguminosarum TaxID=384 RepID=UPI001C9693D2|nr:DGQHR domain-containing protein [Rhizobium leguminosarum]MBY5579528.1 DGQHR domain-containing protein [Rhizobium leguminosarum]
MSTTNSAEMEEIVMVRPTFNPEPGPFEAPKSIPAIIGPKLVRADVPIITGFIPAGALIPDNFVVPHRNPSTGQGYQRLPQEARINELVTDLRKGRVDLPTSVLLNIRNRDARRAFKDGILNLAHVAEGGGKLGYEPKFYVVDGQHRILALKKLIEEFEGERWSKYQIPFTCMLGATEEEEMDQFYTVNSKAKSVRTDLAYELLSQRAQDAEVMESLVERGRDWQVTATNIVKELSTSSPVWRNRIRFAAMEKGDTVMPSASMISSLKQVLSSPYFKVLSSDQQVAILDSYWRGIRDILPEAFDEPSDFSIQKGIGVTVLHTLFTPVLEIARSRGASVTEPETYHKILRSAFDRLEGENASGDPVSGLNFWRAAPLGAAGSYSSSAGRRVLIARMQQRLPKITVQ